MDEPVVPAALAALDATLCVMRAAIRDNICY